MPLRNLDNDFVAYLKMYRYAISYELVKKDFKISKSVFYEILKNNTYKEVISIKNASFFDKYKKIKKEPNAIKYNIYNSNKLVNDISSGVYLIQNTENGKCYVGSSYNIRQRLLWHYNKLENGKHPNIKLQNSFNKYEKENFMFTPILNCPKEYNHILEQWVKDKSAYNCYFNIAENCERPSIGRKLTQEQKDKISEHNKGFRWSEECKQRLKNTLKKIKDKNPIIFKNKRLDNFKGLSFTGSNNGNSKLTEQERLDIIDLINKGIRNKDIIAIYPQISSKLITEVKSGRTWKQLQILINR